MEVLAEKWEGFPPPENRLVGAIIAGPLLVVGCFWLGWTGEYTRIPWYVPMLSTIPIGCAVNLVFASILVSDPLSLLKPTLTSSLELLDRHVFVSPATRPHPQVLTFCKNVHGVCFCR